MRLEFSAYAREDLLGILTFIARDNPKQARQFVASLRQQCNQLTEFPMMGVAKPEYAPDLRMLPYQRYLIFFSVHADKQIVLIERVLHSARNISEVLAKDKSK